MYVTEDTNKNDIECEVEEMIDSLISAKFEELDLCYNWDTIINYDFDGSFKYDLDEFKVKYAIRKLWRNKTNEEVQKVVDELYNSGDLTSVGEYYHEYLTDYYESEAREKYREWQGQRDEFGY